MQYIPLILVFILAGIEAEVVGFGISTISMAFLPLFIPLRVAIPLVAMVSLVATGIVSFRTKTKNLRRVLLPLLVGSILGIPLGLYFLKKVSEETLLVALGVILVFAGSFSLLGKKIKLKFDRQTGTLIGFLAGFFGASVNVNGPLIGVFSTKSGQFSKYENKDMTTTYMFVTGFFVVLGHYLAGRVTKEIFSYFVIVLPALLVGLQIGKNIFERIPEKLLKTIIYLFVLAAGLRLIFK